jgi:hypothetical protein
MVCFYPECCTIKKPEPLRLRCSSPYFSSKTITVKTGSTVDLDKYLSNESSLKRTVTCTSNLSVTKDSTDTADAPGKGKIRLTFGKFKLTLKVMVQ